MIGVTDRHENYFKEIKELRQEIIRQEITSEEYEGLKNRIYGLKSQIEEEEGAVRQLFSSTLDKIETALENKRA